jgi:hypothetical protein
MTDAFLPLMSEHGRIVNISSGLGNCERWGMTRNSLEKRLHAAKSVKEADDLAQEFLVSISYELFLPALTRAFATECDAQGYGGEGWVGRIDVFSFKDVPQCIDEVSCGYFGRPNESLISTIQGICCRQ